MGSVLPTQHVEVSLDGEWMETNRTYQHIENQDVYFDGLPQDGNDSAQVSIESEMV